LRAPQRLRPPPLRDPPPRDPPLRDALLWLACPRELAARFELPLE